MPDKSPGPAVWRQLCAAAALLWIAGVQADVTLINQTRFCDDTSDVAISQLEVATGDLVEAADDFQISVADNWSPTLLEVVGHYAGSRVSAGGVDVSIYRNSRGSPGGLTCFYSSLTPTGGFADADFSLDLAAAESSCTLPSGSYWISVILRLNNSLVDWYWGQTDDALNAQYQMRQPTGPDTLGCRDWTDANECALPATPDLGLCFRLRAATAPRLVQPFADDVIGVGSAYGLATAANFDDSDGDTLTYSAIGLPPSLTIDADSGLIAGIVAGSDLAGSPYRVSVTAMDDDGNVASGDFQLTLNDLSGVDFRFQRMWPVLQQPWYFGAGSRRLHVTDDGLFVANENFKLVQQFSLDGLLVASFGIQRDSGEAEIPVAVAARDGGDIYVAGQLDGQIHKVANGMLRSKFGGYPAVDGPFADVPAAIATADSGCNLPGPQGRVVTRGCVFVGAGGTVYQYDTAGTLLRTFGQCRTASDCSQGGLESVTDLIVFSDMLYGLDGDNRKLVAWRIRQGSAPQLVFERAVQEGSGLSFDPPSVGVDGLGRLYVPGNDIEIYDGATGSLITAIPEPERGITDLAFSRSGVGFYSRPGAIQRVQVQDTRFTVVLAPGLRLSPSGPGPGNFGGASQLTTDSTNRVWVLDAGRGIQVFDADGNYQFEVPQPTVNGIPRFVDDVGSVQDGAVERIAVLVDAAPDDPVVQLFDMTGGLVSEFSLAGVSSVRAIDGDANGLLYIAADELYQFDLAGAQLNQWSSTTGERFHTVSVDARGNVFATRVEGAGAAGVEIFSGDGALLGGFDRPLALSHNLAINRDGLLLLAESNVDNRSADSVFVLRADGTELGSFGPLGFYPGQFDSILGFDFGANGVLYASDSRNDRVQAFQVLESIDNTKVVMVMGGGPYPGNNLWDATRINVNFAYVAMLYQGFSPDNIQLLSAQTNFDLDGNGLPDDVDGDATVANLQDALLNWAADADNLILYLADHGAAEVFRMSETELLDASTLGGWLDQLQGSVWTSPGRIITLYEACESGSFMDDLSSGTYDRVVMTTANEGQDANFVSQGFLSFSNQFWTRIFNGDDLKDAFSGARDTIVATYPDQSPQLNADGDSISNEPGEDIDAVAGVFFGSGNLNVGTGPDVNSVVPVVSPPQTLAQGNSASIEALGVTDTDGVAKAWAVLRPPQFQSGAANNPVLELPQVELIPNESNPANFAADYAGFSAEGVYVIDVFARDNIGNVTGPVTTTLSVGNPLSRKAIIVTAGEPSDAGWPAFNLNSNLAYQAFVTQGYLDVAGGLEEIRYLSQGGTQGVDQGTTLANIDQAIAAAADAQDVTLYVAGGRASRSGLIINGAGEVLTPVQLNIWLDSLQQQIPGTVTVILDHSLAGTFLAALGNGSSDRIVITSASATAKAAFFQDGALSFSQFFFNRITNGQSVQQAFQVAAQAIAFINKQQNPQLDDNGNGRGNDATDGMLAAGYFLGPGLVQAGNAPAIGAIDPDLVLNGVTSAAIGVDDVTTTAQISRVFGVVNGPPPQSPTGDFMLDSLVRKGTGGNGSYQGTYDQFGPVGGVYEVAVFAEDTSGSVSFQEITTVQQAAGPDGYEDDDSASQAAAIFVDDSATQPHNFHDDADTDWQKFIAIDGENYDIRASAISAGTSLEIAVVDGDGVTVLTSGTGSTDLTVSWTGNGDGVRYLRVRAPDVADRGSYQLSIFRPIGFQVGQLEGLLTNALNGQPVVGAFVTSSGNAASFTDVTGLFRITDAVGSYTAQIIAPGFETLAPLPAFDLFEAQTTFVNLAMTPVAGPPEAQTDPASLISQTGAVLNGQVTPNGLETSVLFRWGNNPGSLDQAITAAPAQLSGSLGQTAVAADLAGLLTCGTGYQFAVEADNSADPAGGLVQGNTRVFTTADCTAPPTLSDVVADQITVDSARLSAMVNANGSDTTAAFDLGLTSSYGVTLPVAGTLSGNSPAMIEVTATSLACGTAYHYRARAVNPGGETAAADQTFTTAGCPQSPPLVTTLPVLAGSISASGAEIRANVDPQDASTSVEYQLKTAQSAPDDWLPTGADISAFQTVSVVLTGLDCGRGYFYQFRAGNSGGQTIGAELSFATSDCPPGFPTVTTGEATGITQQAARLEAVVNPQGSPATVTFDYGLSDAYGQSVTLSDAVTGTTDQAAGATAIGLQCGTRYHFRARAGNAVGSRFGQDRQFETLPCQQILLVDDDDNLPDVGGVLSAALDTLGFGYQVWNTSGTDNEPTVDDLAAFDTVLWVTGNAAGPATGPGSAAEQALALHAAAGACLVVSSQDYFSVRGASQPTPLMVDILGVASGLSDVGQTTMTGAGADFSGLGPYTLDFAQAGLTDRSDSLVPAADAITAFIGSNETAAVRRRGVAFNSVYLAFPLAAIASPGDRAATIASLLQYCRDRDRIFFTGFEGP